MEGDPHQLVEGVICGVRDRGRRRVHLSALGVHAARPRGSSARSRRPTRRLSRPEHLRLRFNLELHLHVSAGRYICGEETALLNALEGKRGNPRSKPPFPAVERPLGQADGRVNNVETICNVPAHRRQRRRVVQEPEPHSEGGGTKLFGASGRVKRAGLWELPMGTPLREILEEHAGGMQDGVTVSRRPAGRRLNRLPRRAITSTCAMDYASVQKAGSRLGTGTIIVLDDQDLPGRHGAEPRRLLRAGIVRLVHAVPGGLHWVADVLTGLEEGRASRRSRSAGGARAAARARPHYCALAPGAAEPLQSALKYFRDDFERHIREHRCPWRLTDGDDLHRERAVRRDPTREPAARVPLARPQPALFLLASRRWDRSARAGNAPSSSSGTRTTRTASS